MHIATFVPRSAVVRSTPGARLWSSGKRMLSKNALAVALNAAQPEVLVMVLLPRLLARAADDDCCFEDVGTKRKRPFSKVRPSPWLVMLFIVTTIARTSSDVHTTPTTSKPMSACEISDPAARVHLKARESKRLNLLETDPIQKT